MGCPHALLSVQQLCMNTDVLVVSSNSPGDRLVCVKLELTTTISLYFMQLDSLLDGQAAWHFLLLVHHQGRGPVLHQILHLQPEALAVLHGESPDITRATFALLQRDATDLLPFATRLSCMELGYGRQEFAVVVKLCIHHSIYDLIEKDLS